MLGSESVAVIRSVTKRFVPSRCASCGCDRESSRRCQAELLALNAQHRCHKQRARLVQEPMRLRLTRAEPRRLEEAVDDALAVKERQPILRSPLSGAPAITKGARERLLLRPAPDERPAAGGRRDQSSSMCRSRLQVPPKRPPSGTTRASSDADTVLIKQRPS
jgi:hypothetical protein